MPIDEPSTANAWEGHGGAQRRNLTLLFCDLSDSTRLGELMEAEDYADLLAQLRALFQQVVARHRGEIARIQGDGVLAFFGHPLPAEDDARRALEAAIELHLAVSRIPVTGPAASLAPLTLHTGIHGGTVLLAGGDIERGRFDLVGNVPNIAARLSSLAERDDILISEETLGPHARYFHIGEHLETRVKGRTASISIYRVLGRAVPGQDASAAMRRALYPFVGRQGPLRQLRDHLRRAMAGTPQCVTVQGDPGVGKTRLVDELRRYAAADECLFLKGYCESYFRAEPMQPFAQMLRALADSGDAVVAQLLQEQGELAGRGVAAFPQLVDALSHRRPLLLVIDDWQWADDGSQQLLDAVLALPGARRILVVLATRERAGNELLARHSGHIELLPLDDSEAGDALAHMLPGCDPFMAAEIRRHAGGVPLYLEELCHSASAGSDISGAGRPGSGAWLQTLIGSRVERLPPAQAELVRAAAIIGNVFPSWLLARVAGDDLAPDMLNALAAQDLIYPDDKAGNLRFKHGITREVVYDSVGLHWRRELHRRIVGALESGPPEEGTPEDWNEALAYHCAAGELHEQAARHAEAAGNKALAVSALDRARDQYVAALRSLDALAPLERPQQLRWCAIAQRLGVACVFDPLGLADAMTIFRRHLDIARQTGDVDAMAHAEYWMGYVCYAKGLARQSVAHCEAALALAQHHGMDRLAAQVRATLGQALLSSCGYERALGLLDDALDSKRRQSRPGGSMAVGSAYTLACKGYLLGDRGLFDDAQACFDEALALLGDTVHQVAASVRHWHSVVALWQGRWSDALRSGEEATDIAGRVKSRQQYAMGRALAGYARWMQTRAPESMRAVREATAWIDARQGGLATSLNHGWLVEGSLALADVEAARRHAARMFVRVRQDDRIGEALACRALAQAAARTHDFNAAHRYLRQAYRSADARGSAHERAVTQMCEGQIELMRDQGAAGRALLAQARDAFSAMNMAWHADRAERALRL
ncbi:ATP-binding protein [Variovorax sp.]|uniref:ATP-binding protein n=1 Tax=Variovorax sp. TaxID=1871043 RepID=UPI002D5F5170|nr:AAA family ATPase [Variovorax sp.]HYP85851.1 AAA family ATPase [Variovorax sp.]